MGGGGQIGCWWRGKQDVSREGGANILLVDGGRANRP